MPRGNAGVTPRMPLAGGDGWGTGSAASEGIAANCRSFKLRGLAGSLINPRQIAPSPLSSDPRQQSCVYVAEQEAGTPIHDEFRFNYFGVRRCYAFGSVNCVLTEPLAETRTAERLRRSVLVTAEKAAAV